MTPAARLQAAIEILDQVIEATRTNGAAADTLVARYFSRRRYAGSKDRRAIRELVYAAIRRYNICPENGRAAFIGLAQDRADLSELFDGSSYGPAEIGQNETAAKTKPLPDWLRGRFSDVISEDDIASLSGRAPLDVRVNTSRLSRASVLAELSEGVSGKFSDRAIRLPSGFPVEKHELWRNGSLDIQDEGSQLVADACGVRDGTTIIDLCAGAGGKTLALADLVDGNARLIACDTDRSRLSRLAPRAKRCGFTDVEERLLNPGKESGSLADLTGKADHLLIDAPCSGTGTWRRNPEARWRMTPAKIDYYRKMQRYILQYAADLVAPGGYLLYAVCSLLHDEGEGQISSFLESRSDFRKVEPAIATGVNAGVGYILTPARHGTDGFFFARLQRAC